MHNSPISGVAASIHGLVATAGYDSRLILWRDGRVVATNYHDHLVNFCSFNSTGEFVVSASSDRTARVWSVPELKPIATLFGHEDDVEMAVFSPDDERIATASRDGRVRVFSADGECQSTLRGHTADVTSVAWSANGQELFSSSDDGTIRRWCAVSHMCLEVIELGGIETDTVIVSADGSVFYGNDDGEVRRVLLGQVSTIRAHTAGVKRIVLARDGSRLLSLSYDRHLCVFNVTAAGIELVHRCSYPSIIWARSAAFLTASKLIFGSFGNTYATLNVDTGRWEIDHIGDTPGFNFVQSTPLGVISVGDSGRVFRQGEQVPLAEFHELCNFITPHAESLFIGGQTGRVYECPSRRLLSDVGQPLNCAVSNGENLVVGSYTGEILIIDPRSGDIVARERLLKNAIKGIALHGGVGLAVGAARDLCWFDSGDGRVLHYVEEAHDKIANGCAHLEGDRFVSVSRDGYLRFFEYGHDRVEKVRTPVNHSVKCVATDGRNVAVGSYGGQVAIFDAQSRTWIRNERPTRFGISSLAYGGFDGKLHASSYDGRVYEI